MSNAFTKSAFTDYAARVRASMLRTIYDVTESLKRNPHSHHDICARLVLRNQLIMQEVFLPGSIREKVRRQAATRYRADLAFSARVRKVDQDAKARGIDFQAAWKEAQAA